MKENVCEEKSQGSSTSTGQGRDATRKAMVAFHCYTLAAALLLAGGSVTWIIMVFPFWVVALISACILIRNRQSRLQRLEAWHR
jgi:Flp pilus assembly protein TadB